MAQRPPRTRMAQRRCLSVTGVGVIRVASAAASRSLFGGIGTAAVVSARASGHCHARQGVLSRKAGRI